MSESLKVEMGIEDAGEFFDQESQLINQEIEASKGTPREKYSFAVGKLLSLASDETVKNIENQAA